ncbi:MAG: hypothetical protein M3021_04835, partial [Actinomycetota bacterium]|nr:hypothetical protein [Actinomycetota bacterium]
IYGGSGLTLPTDDGQGYMFVLQVLSICGLLELRAEPVPVSTPDENIWQEFGFVMTNPVTPGTAGHGRI